MTYFVLFYFQIMIQKLYSTYLIIFLSQKRKFKHEIFLCKPKICTNIVVENSVVSQNVFSGVNKSSTSFFISVRSLQKNWFHKKKCENFLPQVNLYTGHSTGKKLFVKLILKCLFLQLCSFFICESKVFIGVDFADFHQTGIGIIFISSRVYFMNTVFYKSWIVF